MFLKKNDKLESIIGPLSEFNGDISVDGTLRVDGKVNGNITSSWVIVGEKAVIKGDIFAKGVVIGGRVDGTVKAEEIVELKPSGHLYGDIHTNKVSIAEGSVFMGRCLTQRDEMKLLDFEGEEARTR